MPAKPCGAGVCETFRTFQIASPASWSPALRPTRGSGDGAARSGADMSGPDCIGDADIDADDGDPPHPAATTAASTEHSAVK